MAVSEDTDGGIAVTGKDIISMKERDLGRLQMCSEKNII